jgi:zona occludens toxin (predicted ATPase)
MVRHGHLAPGVLVGARQIKLMTNLRGMTCTRMSETYVMTQNEYIYIFLFYCFIASLQSTSFQSIK